MVGAGGGGGLGGGVERTGEGGPVVISIVFKKTISSVLCLRAQMEVLAGGFLQILQRRGPDVLAVPGRGIHDGRGDMRALAQHAGQLL